MKLKKNNLIFIPSGQFDIGHTLLDRYEETVEIIMVLLLTNNTLKQKI